VRRHPFERHRERQLHHRQRQQQVEQADAQNVR
jgi:hypothetical protein